MPYEPMATGRTDEVASDRSRAAALALAGVLGFVGAHRFYVGKPGTGFLMLCTFGGLGLWWLYDIILLSAGAFRDAEGKRVVNWVETNVPGGGRPLTPRQQELLFEELDTLRSDYHELAERVDFMERMLAKVRDRAMPPGR